MTNTCMKSCSGEGRNSWCSSNLKRAVSGVSRDKEEFGKTIWACRDYARLNKVQWELHFAWNVKGNRNSFDGSNRKIGQE